MQMKALSDHKEGRIGHVPALLNSPTQATKSNYDYI